MRSAPFSPPSPLRLVLPLGLLMALLLTAPMAHAQWKWRDQNGRVTASDLPPPRDVADKDIISRPAAVVRRANAAAPAASAASAVVAAKSPLEKEIDARKRTADQEQQAKAKAEEERQAALHAGNCQRARSQIATLDSGQRLSRINDKGEREVLDDKVRGEERRQAREVIATECK